MRQLFQLFRSLVGLGGNRHSSPRRRPALEVLEDRAVPAVVDLTSAGAQHALGAALFQQTVNDAGGNGNLEPFVRLSSNSKTGLAQGYNTDVRPLQLDEYSGKTWTHSLRVSDVPIVPVNSVNYREFVVDVDQRNSSPMISLDDFRIYGSNSPNLFGYDSTSKKLAGLSAVYDMDAGGDNVVILNASLQPGGGRGDARVLVPDSLLSNSSYVYLYSKFGATVTAEGGYESWAIRLHKGTTQPPPSSSPASVSGYVYMDDNANGVMDSGEAGISGVVLTLTGTTSSGQSVSLTATTDANGFYSFLNLQAGTYTISRPSVSGCFDGASNLGTVSGSGDGTVQSDGSLAQIVLRDGDQGLLYNFGEIVLLA